MFKTLRAYVSKAAFRKARKNLVRLRERADELVRAIENSQMLLHENPPACEHQADELRELFDEFERLGVAHDRASDAISRCSFGLTSWARYAVPLEKRSSTPARWSEDNPQPASPFSEGASVAEPRPISVEEVMKEEPARRRKKREDAPAQPRRAPRPAQ